MTTPDDADLVLAAIRLGWYVAEVRGRNRPDGPHGATADMPRRVDKALPLRAERSAEELRIEAQAVVGALAVRFAVNRASDDDLFSVRLDDRSRVLARTHPAAVVKGLKRSALRLSDARQCQIEVNQAVAALPPLPPDDPERAALLNRKTTAEQRLVETTIGTIAELEELLGYQVDLAAKEQAAAEQAAAAAVEAPPDGQTAKSVAAHATDLQLAAQAARTAAMTVNLAAMGTRAALAGPQDAVGDAAVIAVQEALDTIVGSATAPWRQLSSTLWDFDAHVQDQLTSVSDTQALGYQLGRGLAECYWALNPDPDSQIADGKPVWSSWNNLLGDERCNELSRLVGRLSAYMPPYTSTAVAGSIEVWRKVGREPSWRPDPDAAAEALYRQIRRWYELIVLKQEPTTLITPYKVVTNRRALTNSLRFFWPQLLFATVGAGGLTALVILLSNDSSDTWLKSISGLLAAAGIPAAGLTGKLKNATQAILTRLRQDAYAELVAISVTVVPKAAEKKAKEISAAIGRRRLTAATPH